MRRLVLDTNAYTALLSGNVRILEALGRADAVYVPVIVLGELHAGFRLGSRHRQNEETLERFLRKPTVRTLPVTAETAEVFGEIKSTLRRNGTPLPMNDVWIASLAVEHGAVLVTFDAHFARIHGLRRWPSD